jgi:5-methylcytosine-specific restriction protein A
MTKEEIHAIYEMAKKIYHEEEILKEGEEKLFTSHGSNKNSFKDYCGTFKALLNGSLYKWRIGVNLRDYFLERILADYGKDKLRNALDSYKLYIEHYKIKENSKDQKCYEKYIKILNKHNSISFENEINSYYEGDLKQVTTTIRKRNIEARNECIKIKGAKCRVCKFDFEKAFGELGKGFIHVHHINPISDKKGEYEITPDDLVPVCPNCHAMLHRKKDITLSIEELKEIIEQNKNK